MRIADILRNKGSEVVTIRSDATVNDLLDLLTERRIGAVVVSDVEGEIAGIVSERDIVRQVRNLTTQQDTVAQIMTTDVVTCTVEEEIEDLAQTMTDRRFRHLPVVEEGRLIGIVSIGDVVKGRLDDLQYERDHLQAYVQFGT